MTPMWQFVLYLLALICLALAAIGEPAAIRRRGIGLVPLGLALITVVWVVQAGQAAF